MKESLKNTLQQYNQTQLLRFENSATPEENAALEAELLEGDLQAEHGIIVKKQDIDHRNCQKNIQLPVPNVFLL